MVHKAGWAVAAIIVVLCVVNKEQQRKVETKRSLDSATIKLKLEHAHRLATELKEYGQSLETRALMASALCNIDFQEENGVFVCEADCELKAISVVLEEKAEKIETSIKNVLKELE